MKNRFKIILFCTSALVFIGCDRVTKDLAKEHLMNKPVLSYFHNSFQLVYAENTGAAMNFGDNLPKAASFWLLGMLPLAFLIFLSGYVVRHSKEMHLPKIISFALII